jgi:transposase
VGENLRRRSLGRPPEVLAFSLESQERLSCRYRRLTGRGKRSSVAVVAVARELSRAIWHLMRLEAEAA